MTAAAFAPPERESKSFLRVEWKADKQGDFKAVFATLGVIDRDGDVTIPGAFKDGQEVAIASWGHDWATLPVGEGVIHSNQKEAWVDGTFYLDTPQGDAHYKTVKRRGDRQQWSYGFDVLKSRFGVVDDKDVRILEQMDVWEVSPVMLAAGVDTRTTAIKGGLTLADDVERALGSVVTVTHRARSLADLRAKEGKGLSSVRREQLAGLVTAIKEAETELAKMLAETEREPKVDSLRLRSEFTKTRARLSREFPALRLS